MKFLEWLPDQDEFENPGLVECKNVIPGTFYKPFRDLVPSGTAMNGVCLGAVSYKGDSGATYNFGGTSDKIYRAQSGSWTETNTGYTTAGENVWNFSRFGDFIIANNFDNNIQKYDISTDTAFADLAGSPPRAKLMTVVKDFLVLGHTASNANEVYWSGINDVTQWTKGDDESDSQLLAEGGPITGLVGGEYGLVFQEERITRMTYQGPPFTFLFDVIEEGIGCIASGSVIKFGVRTFYLSHNGFYFTDGTQSYPIGSEKVDKYFFKKVDLLSLYRMSAVIDPINKLVIWSYVGKDSTDGNPNWLIIYNWDLKRWSEIEKSVETLFVSLSTGVDVEGLDALYTNLDTMDVSMDSRIFQGGTSVLSAVDTDHKFATFNGDVLAGYIKTGEFELNEGEKTIVTQVWPQIDGTITCKISSRDNYQSTPQMSGGVAVNSIGFAPFDKNARFHSFEFDFTDWSKASGFKIKAEATGEY